MNLLKPAIAALFAAGLVGSAFAASGYHHTYNKRAAKYGHAKMTRCSSNMLPAAIGNSFHAVNKNCWGKRYAFYGDTTFAYYNGNAKVDVAGTAGKAAGVALTSANFGIDASASSKVMGHLTLGFDNNFIKTDSAVQGGAVASATKKNAVTLPWFANVKEAYVVYQDNPVFVKMGQFNLPVSMNSAEGVMKSFTHSVTSLNASALQVGFHNDMGFDGSVLVYNGYKTAETETSKLAFGATGNYAGAQKGIGYHVHAGLMSDPRQSFATTDHQYTHNVQDNLIVNNAVTPALMATTKAALLFNVEGGVTYQNFMLNVDYTAMGNMNDGGANDLKLNLIGVKAGYQGKVSRMPFGVMVGYEMADKKSVNVLNIKNSMSFEAHVAIVPNMDVGFQFVSDKGTAGFNDKKQSSYFLVGTKVSF